MNCRGCRQSYCRSRECQQIKDAPFKVGERLVIDFPATMECEVIEAAVENGELAYTVYVPELGRNLYHIPPADLKQGAKS